MITKGTLRIGTINIRGLKTSLSQKNSKFNSLRNLDLDILLIQETHCTPNLINNYTTQFLPHKSYWSYNCGIVIFNNINTEKLYPNNFTTLIDSHLISVDINYNDITYTLASIYIPQTHTKKRIALDELLKIEFKNPLIIGGDFNCYTNPLIDRHPIINKPIMGHLTFSEFIMNNHLIDTSKHLYKEPSHSRYNIVNNVRLSSTRIDYIFVHNSLIHLINSSKSEIIQTTDHNLITTLLKNSTKPELKLPKILPHHTTTGRFQKKVKSILNKEPPTNIPAWITFKSSLLNKNKNIAYKTRNRENSQYIKAINTMNHLEKNKPKYFNVNWSTQWARAFNIVRQYKEKKDILNRLKAGAKWLKVGDTSSKLFLAKYRKRQVGKQIDEILDDNNFLIDNDIIKGQFINEYYNKLYRTEGTNHEAINEFISEIADDTPKDPSSLLHPISSEELLNIITKLPPRKAPGPDGIPYETYQNNHKILPYMLLIFNICLQKIEPLPDCNLSNLILLFKKGDKRKLSNWRPIALSNTDSKILSKILSTRLGKILSNTIHPNQYGFIPDRSILDNIFLVTNIINDTTTTGILTFLDQEKAYDRVDWNYLLISMKIMGLDTKFIEWCINSLANSKINIITGNLTIPQVTISRGLRQGDPLSPLLYNISINPLLIFLGKSLSGIPTHLQPPLKIVAFADDCVVAISSQEDSLKADTILKLYSKASQSKINDTKTETINLSDNSTISFRNNTPSLHPVRHLGVMISRHGIEMQLMESNLLAKLKNRLSSWALATPTIIGKITLLNTFLTSTLTYLATIFPMSMTFLDKIQSIYQLFLWGKRPPTSISNISPPKTTGGLGLLSPKNHCLRQIGKWISKVLRPSTESDWEHASNHIIFSHLYNKAPYNSTTLSQYLRTRSNSRGPRNASGISKRFLNTLWNDSWCFTTRQPYDRNNLVLITHHGTDINSDYPPEKIISQAPVFHLLSHMSQNLQSRVFQAIHDKTILPKYRINNWRAITNNYISADRISTLSCTHCQTKDTLIHRFFQCSLISNMWEIIETLVSDSRLNNTSHINWFFVQNTNRKKVFASELFSIGLWTAHVTFLNRINGNNPSSTHAINTFYMRTIDYFQMNLYNKSISIGKLPSYIRIDNPSIFPHTIELIIPPHVNTSTTLTLNSSSAQLFLIESEYPLL